MPDFNKVANLLNDHGIEVRIGPYTGSRCVQGWGISPNALGLYVNDVFVCPSNPEVSALPYLMLSMDFCGYCRTLLDALQSAVTWSGLDDAEYAEQRRALGRVAGLLDV